MSHPRRLRAWKVACVQTMQRNPSSFGSNVQPRSSGIGPERASIGSGSRNTSPSLPRCHGLGYLRGQIAWAIARISSSVNLSSQ
jgi:hypothetical protein